MKKLFFLNKICNLKTTKLLKSKNWLKNTKMIELGMQLNMKSRIHNEWIEINKISSNSYHSSKISQHERNEDKKYNNKKKTTSTTIKKKYRENEEELIELPIEDGPIEFLEEPQDLDESVMPNMWEDSSEEYIQREDLIEKRNIVENTKLINNKEKRESIKENLLNLESTQIQATPSMLNSFLLAATQNKNFPLVRKYMRKLFFELQQPPRIETTMSALSLYFKNRFEDTEEVAQIFSKLKEMKQTISPASEYPPSLYRIISEIFLLQNQVESSKQVLEEAFQIYGEQEEEIQAALLEHKYYVEGIENLEEQIAHLKNNGFHNSLPIKNFYLYLIKFASKLMRTVDVDHFVSKVQKLGYMNLAYTQGYLISEFVEKKDKEKLEERLISMSKSFSYKNGDLLVLMEIIKTYGEKRKLENALYLFDVIFNCSGIKNLEKVKENPSGILIFYSSLAKEFSYLNQYQVVDLIFNRLLDNGVPLDSISVAIFLHCFGTMEKNAEKVDRLMQIVEKQNVPVDETIASLSKKIYLSLSNKEKAEEWTKTLQNIQSKKPLINDNLVFQVCKSGDVVQAESMFRELLKQGSKPTFLSFKSIILMFSKREMFREAFFYYRLMIRNYKYTPTSQVSLYLLNCCPIERLVSLWKYFEVNNWINSNASVFESVIYRYSTFSYNKAFKIYEEMIHRGLEPRILCYKHLVTSALCAQKDKIVMRVLKFLRSNEEQVKDQDKPYYLWIYLYLKDQPAIEKLLDTTNKTEQEKKDIYQILQSDFFFLISTFCSAGMPYKALHYYDFLLSLGAKSEDKVLVPIIKCLGECSNKESLDRFIEEKQIDLTNSSELRCAVACAYLKLNVLEAASLYIDYSNLDGKMITALFDFWSLSRNNEKILDLIETVKNQNKMTLQIANSILLFHKSMQDVEAIHSLFSYMISCNIRPDDTTFSIIFSILPPDETPKIVYYFKNLIRYGVLINNKPKTPLSISLHPILKNKASKNAMWKTIVSMKKFYPLNVQDIRFLIDQVEQFANVYDTHKPEN